MSLVMWLIFGAVAGSIAKWLMPGKCPLGWFPTIALGIVGSFAGGLLGSVIGACVVMFVYSMWSADQ